VNRRTVLTSLFAAPPVLAPMLFGQQTSAPDRSLYIPKAQLVEDRKLLHDFMDEFPFVELVTAAPGLRITHIPTILDRDAGPTGTILGHISAQNPQRAAFDGAHEAVIVFRGPQGYISPSWYTKQDVVPTWNFAVVHASGRPTAITEASRVRALLARLIKKYEASVGSSAYDFDKLPESYVGGLMKGIAAFEMHIEGLEGKFKLGQERSEADKQGVLDHLRAGGYRERSLHEITEAFYRSK
jgi:transcriptional regulator